MDNDEFAGQFYKLESISVSDKKFLGNVPLNINDRTNINDDNFFKAAQLDKDWPNGRAIYVGKSTNGDKTFIMKINYIDHLEIIIEQK
jgi:hypothetical protein